MTVRQNLRIRAGIRILLTNGLVMLTTLLIAFSVSCQATPPTEEEAASTSTEINISGFAFVPATVTVTVGTTVTWTNLDSVAHTVTSETDLFDSGNLARNATFSYSFADRGTFSYYCANHPSILSERSKVIVE